MEQDRTNQPPFLEGEKVTWHGGFPVLGSGTLVEDGAYHGKIRWMGKIKEYGSTWIAGVELEKSVKGASDGTWQARHIFSCKSGHGLVVPAEKLHQKSSKISETSLRPATNERSFFKMKDKKNCATKDISKTSDQNVPGSPKLSAGKGGTASSKDVKINSCSSDTVVENLNSKKTGSSSSIKNVFGSISKKEKKGQYSTSLEIVLQNEEQVKTQRGGFLNIFKWFSKKENFKQDKTSVDKMSGRGVGSTTSLVSDSSSITFFPIRHSVSADNSNSMMKSYNKNAPLSSQSHHVGERRSSSVSMHSDISLNSRAKKRLAPKPPDSLSCETNNSVLGNGFESPSTSRETKFFEKAQSEGPLFCGKKRKAPPPPVANKSPMPIKSTPTSHSISKSIRPLSTLSNFSSISHSGSSTLQSSTCSENDSLTLKSDSSHTSFPFNRDLKGPLSPKPWYKRKKIKDKSHKSKKDKKGNADDQWMPDIQYARQNVNAAEPHSLQGKNIETFFDRGPQLGQRFSILSSISDLDRAATEQFEREKAQKNASKLDKEAIFYTKSSPHILCQKDLVPSCDEQEGAVALGNDINADSNNVFMYDNLSYSNENNSLPLSYSKQPTLKLDSEDTVAESPVPNAPDIILIQSISQASEKVNHYDTNTVNYEKYLEQIREELKQEDLENFCITGSKSTPKDRTVFDPELFYQLAKDARMNRDLKPTSSARLTQEKDASKGKDNVHIILERPAFNYRHKPKNFGFRMNNFFTPDVSTIMEGTESVTSSNATTTPAEDFNEDSQNRSALGTDYPNDFMSLNSDLNSEYRINTSDLQDIIESFALDLRRSDRDGGSSRPNVEIEGDERSRKTKADKIREEVLLLREKDNFLAWQKRMQGTELTKEDDETAIQERKKKWICDSCTLINQPWRLHCEACGSLRPPNPRRIDGEISPSSPTTENSLHSASNDSQVTVIHDDRSGIDTFNDSATSESHVLPGCSYKNSDTDSSTPNLNWEKELQSYFTQFDDHTNAIRKINSGNSNSTSSRLNAIAEEDSNAYGKILVTRKKESNGVDEAEEKFGFRNAVMKAQNGVDMQEIRRARIRKFQLNYSSVQEQQNLSSNSTQQCSNQKMYFVSGIQEKISQLTDQASSEHRQRECPAASDEQASRFRDSSSLFTKDEDKQFYKNEYKKSPVLKPSGAVKSAVSIFNQMDQLKAVQEKPAPVKAKRRSFSNILNFGDFERLISGTSNEINSAATPPPLRTTSPVMADIDIASAINKFDEMAALAEIENIRKPVPKIPKKWLMSKVVSNSENKLEIDKNKYEETNIEDISERNSGSNTQHDHASTHRIEAGASNVLKAENRDSCDSVIKDGILYTSGETRRRSMSIGSGTFELMNAKEFASIEAHHSRRPSPCDEFDAPSALELAHPLLMPEIQITSTSNSHNECPENQEPDDGLPSTGAVERLSRQLTEVDGIETFKATLARDQPKLGENKTKTINRLLKQLEVAISSGKHEEASRFAHDLAKLRLECNVMNKMEVYSSQLNYSAVNSNYDKIDSLRQEINSAYSGQHNLGVSTGIQDSENNNLCVVRRSNKTNPNRREVKSDTTSLNLMNAISPEFEDKEFRVKMYVEDKTSHQGPIFLELHTSMTVGDLKLKIFEEFGFPFEVQRWILGRVLADDDTKTLSNYNVTAEGCPIFLYLVAPDSDTKPTSPNMSRSSSYKSYTRSDSDNKPEAIANICQEDTNHILNSENRTQPSSHGNKKVLAQSKKGKDGKLSKVKSSLHLMTKGKPVKATDSPKKVPKNSTEKRNISQPQNQLSSNSFKADGWTCPQCTLINHKDRPGCEACATERPELHSDVGKKKNLRQAMFALEAQGCVANQEPFDCLVCLSGFNKGEGVILRDCLHVFCRYCLTAAVKYSETARVKCPFSDKSYSCQFSLQEREIKDLLSEEDYKKHLDKSVKEAAGSMKNVFYCKTPDCKGFCQFEDNVNVFLCDVCRKANCLTCQAQHGGQTCKQYQDELQHKQDEDALKTKKFFDDIIRRGDGMPCPQCSIMLVRKWGCDWMRCPMCRTEICWVTRMPRWGPEGQGDTSGGCKCGLNGRKCHPKCTYCH